MKTIIGVRFKKPGKIYFFDPGYLKVEKGSNVIVETSMGQEMGEVMISNRELPDSKVTEPLKKIIRVATPKDIEHQKENQEKEKEAFKICEEKIKKHQLDMNLTEVEYKFDNSKIVFYFTADGRIDFRELVKDLAAIFHTRIELRQIGVRDEIKRIGGNGMCGRELCCCSFLRNFETVSIKMAKEQNISLNPTKINGICGRLLCCLNYEDDIYTELKKDYPSIGSRLKINDIEGKVVSLNVLNNKITLEKSDKTQVEVEYKKNESHK